MDRVIGNIVSDLFWGISISNRAMIITKRFGFRNEVYFFRSAWRTNRILNNSHSLLLYSTYKSDSIIKKFICIAPVVYYDNNGFEVLRYSNHSSLQNHEIIFSDGYRVLYDHRKYDFSWRENEIHRKKKGINFECAYNNLYEALILSCNIWYHFHESS